MKIDIRLHSCVSSEINTFCELRQNYISIFLEIITNTKIFSGRFNLEMKISEMYFLDYFFKYGEEEEGGYVVTSGKVGCGVH